MATKEVELNEKNRNGSPDTMVVPNTDVQKGLSAKEVAELALTFGKNEIVLPDVPLYKIFLEEFTTTMAITLEVACIISLALLDWADFGIVFGMIMCNALLGFHEKLKAKRSLEELTQGQKSECAVIRDGVSRNVETRELVPGDLICLSGGMMVPADCVWVKGNKVPVNTKAVTGESIPRKFGGDGPRKIQCGCEIVANTCYAVVTATGENTEIGQSTKQIAADKLDAAPSVFESTVMSVVKVIIGAAFLDVIFLVILQGVIRRGFEDDWHDPILMALSIIVAAIPVALPLVMQVTMAIGCATMAREHHAIVTSPAALQDIAAMTTLCSDKTGTLTTAKMSILNDQIRCFSGADSKKILLYARLVSNPDKKDDPIDKAVIDAFRSFPDFKDDGAASKAVSDFENVEMESFNASVKRVTGVFKVASTGKRIVISKGILSKILDTSSGGKDSGKNQWKVEGYDKIAPEVGKVDESLSRSGYKTIAVCAGIEGESMRFLGILPMIDPPRHDTALIVNKIHHAGVGMKMITGDHRNIAAETARLVGLNASILDGVDSRGGDHVTKHRILEAGGFAEVTMSDKRNIVLTLQKDFDAIVGMMGDGVNDAPALSAANCGIAVDGATDAAKNAADIILTEPGLSAIYGAIVESRRIFSRLNAYVTYRLAATVQIVLLLTILVVAFNCEIKPLYVILLAFFNDVTMTPISMDRADASSAPVKTTLTLLVGLALVFGAVETFASIVFFVLSRDFDGFLDGVDDADAATADGGGCGDYLQAAMFLQICGAAELLIFSARAPGSMFLSSPPSIALLCSTMLGNVIVTVFCAEVEYFGGLSWRDVGVIWAYNLAALVCVDAAKLVYKVMSAHATSGVISDAADEEEKMSSDGSLASTEATKTSDDAQKSRAAVAPRDDRRLMRRQTSGQRLMRFLSSGAIDTPQDIHEKNATLKWRCASARSLRKRIAVGVPQRTGMILPRRLSNVV